MKEANPEAKFGELNGLLAAKWKEASDADKERFQNVHEVSQHERTALQTFFLFLTQAARSVHEYHVVMTHLAGDTACHLHV